jgi:hypothetical protein
MLVDHRRRTIGARKRRDDLILILVSGIVAAQYGSETGLAELRIDDGRCRHEEEV